MSWLPKPGRPIFTKDRTMPLNLNRTPRLLALGLALLSGSAVHANKDLEARDIIVHMGNPDLNPVEAVLAEVKDFVEGEVMAGEDGELTELSPSRRGALRAALGKMRWRVMDHEQQEAVLQEGATAEAARKQAEWEAHMYTVQWHPEDPRMIAKAEALDKARAKKQATPGCWCWCWCCGR